MKFEIAWSEDDKPMARRADRQPLTAQDRTEAKALVDKMLRHEVCWNCADEWSETLDVHGQPVRVCWNCARSA